MDEANDPLLAARAAFGRPVTASGLGLGSALRFRLGSPDSEYSALLTTPWRIETDDEMLAGSDDDLDELAGLVTRLDGLVLQDLRVDPVTLDGTFLFDRGVRLCTFSVSRIEGDDHWLLFLADHHVVVAEPGGPLRLERSDKTGPLDE